MRISRTKLKNAVTSFLRAGKRIRKYPAQDDKKQVICKKVHKTPRDWLELTKYERELHEELDNKLFEETV